MSYDLLKIRNYVTFNTYAPAVLGTTFNNVKVLAVMDEATARQFVDTRAKHNAVYASLPVGTPTTPEDFSFVKIQKQDGSIDFLAFPWINEETIVQESTRTMRLTIDNTTPDDRNRIILALSSIGLTATELVEITD